MIAPPNDIPELMKPNTLPIWPGGAASLTITSRGVRLAPINRPLANSNRIVASCGSAARSTNRNSPALMIVNTTTKLRCRSVRSATQPPTRMPPIAPII